MREMRVLAPAKVNLTLDILRKREDGFHDLAMVMQSMCSEEGRDGMNMNASGRRCASTVFIMLVSGLILYLVVAFALFCLESIVYNKIIE